MPIHEQDQHRLTEPKSPGLLRRLDQLIHLGYECSHDRTAWFLGHRGGAEGLEKLCRKWTLAKTMQSQVDEGDMLKKFDRASRERKFKEKSAKGEREKVQRATGFE